MSTRGAWGIHKDGIDKVCFITHDAYLEGVGKDILEFVRDTNKDIISEIFDRIKLIDEYYYFYPDQHEHVEKYLYIFREIYDLRRATLKEYKNGLRFMLDSINFLGDSLFCEWAYIINLDKNHVEVYKGFNKELQENRFSEYRNDNKEYKEVKLIKLINFRNIKKKFVRVVDLFKDEENKFTRLKI